MRFIKSLLLFVCLAQVVWAAQPLKQSTATTINIGPFIDDTDFKTPKTALTVTGISISLIKQSDTFSSTVTSITCAASGSSNDCQHVAKGVYNVELTAANLDTAGRLEVIATVTGALPVWARFEVIGTTPWESRIVSVASIDDANETDCSTIANANSPAGRACSSKFERYDARGTADSGTTTTVVDTERVEADSAWAERAYIVFTSGTIIGQSAMITGYTASTNTITFSPAVTAAVTTETYEIRSLPSFLRPTVAGRTVAVSVAGAADANVTHVAGTAQTAGDIIADTNDIQLKIGTPAVSLAADIAAAKGDSAAIKIKTDFLPSVTAGAAGGLFIAGTNAATTVTTAFSTTFTGNLTGSVGSVTGAVGSVTGSVGSVTGAVGSVTGSIGGLTAAALANFFNVNSGTTSASAVSGSVVKEIVANAGGAGFTTADIADAVWDEATAGHTTAGTTGKALTDASSAGDPWSTALPGAYSAGTAGKILGDRLDVLVSTRASQTTVDTAQAALTDIQSRIPGSLVSGRMDASVGAMQANVLTVSAINDDAFTAAKFATDASAEFAATLMVTPYEGAETFKHFLQYGAAVLFGKSATSPGLQTFRDLADTKNRISSTTSSAGRTSVTLNPD